ncbi:hypothetical protein CWI39_0127p0020 [Hamiltosporidium magnivora]|uniref:Uncharacterized protein n=1 Tax=Hamiltosporidium magnivora TaxID=148818 RepID=A0A4Q9LKV5_9MICR|nr:hypothetical protein CWI39_0127p0020 [Hamiltosporidium magnivora]
MICIYFLFLTVSKANFNKCLTNIKELNTYENDFKKTIYKFLNKEKKIFLESSKYDLHVFSFDLYSVFLTDEILKIIKIQENIEMIFKFALVSNATLFNLEYLDIFYYYTTKKYTKIVVRGQKIKKNFLIMKKNAMQMYLTIFLRQLNFVFKKMTNYNFNVENFLILSPIVHQVYVNNIILNTSHFFETDIYFYFLLIVKRQEDSEEDTNIVFDINLITLKFSKSVDLKTNSELVYKYCKKHCEKELFLSLRMYFSSKCIIKEGFWYSENYEVKSIFLFNMKIKKLRTDDILCYTKNLYLSLLNNIIIIENSVDNFLDNLQNIIIETKYFIAIEQRNLNSLSNMNFEINVNMNCRIINVYNSRQSNYNLNIKKTRTRFNPIKYEDFISLLSVFF